MEYVEPVVGIANCLGTPVCKYLQYHRKMNDYVRDFKRMRNELNCKMEDIEMQLQAELRPLGKKIPKKGVENWLNDVKEMIREAQVVENKVRNGRYLCRACNGKLVDEKTREMKGFLDKAPNASEGFAIDGPSAGLPLPTSELVGEEAVKKEIWACLMEEEVSNIGVWGMGGVGKTTIMKHIYNDLLKEQRRVIWVTISKEFNVMKVQDDIAGALKLKEYLDKEEDKLRRAAILSEMLKNEGKHVLILDDVWDKVSLEEVGIPEPSGSNGCKLVLTTRSEHVCKYMGCKVIKVKHLSEEEALKLFLNKVGPNIVQSPTIMPTLKLVVKECAGLPLTIVVVAGTMKGEDNPLIWKNALRELKERIGKVEGVEAEVIERLKFSFDHLKDEKVKDCFLYCTVYPEDFEIEMDELFECWIEEGFIDDMGTRQEMKVKGYVILKKLEDNCLLENITTGYGSPIVKMHDAVRDMALSITSMDPRYIVQELPKRGQWSPVIEKVWLMNNSITEFPPDVPPTKCQLLTTLLLRGNPIKEIPYSLFMNIPCLSVLNLSFTKIKSLPNSISELKNLTTLLLRGCEELRDLPCLSMLQELKKLDLFWTKIEEVPEGMDMLIKLRYLELGVFTLKEIPAGLLPKLVHLQHLSFDQINSVGLNAKEMEPLKKLECFIGRFEDISEFNKFMQQSKKSLIKYHIEVGSVSMRAINSTTNKTLAIGRVDNWEGELIMHPIEIQELQISGCHYLRSLVDDNSSFKNAIGLRVCRISYCEGIECVVSLSSFACSSAHPFQSLEKLDLQNLPKLSALIMKDAEIGSATTSTLAPSAIFSHLKVIELFDCPSMKTLFPHWLLPNLQNLEEIRAGHCDELVEIFGAATSEVEEKGSDALIKFHLPKLRELVLMWELPNLKSICSKSGVMVCDSLQLIEVFRGNCNKLKRIPPFVPLVGNGQPFAYAPPSLTIRSSTGWWESLEWDDHPNFKNVLQPRWKDSSKRQDKQVGDNANETKDGGWKAAKDTSKVIKQRALRN
ncbi:hypothetical protein CXB51_009824 [Gossypium anomalum]|uniref:NB-ARC domain-containing protein n=1 Tax=Gossypium anomalum TaxID=47600 RepID=A0A8J6D2A2_9ROSI|nr:hypothetical protein CXB51_009824 [Gossypium anomalum]